MHIHSIFAFLQLVAGGISTLLVFIAYTTYKQPLEVALAELDGIAGNVESEIVTVEGLLKDVDGVAESIQRAMPSHRNSIASVSESVLAVSKTLEEWENQIPGIQEISTDTAHILDTFSSQLPIRIPAVKLEQKLIKFQLPEIIPKTRNVNIPYPTATVQTSTQTLSYPNGARVEMKGWSKDFGKVMGKSLGGVSFDYPSGISISDGNVDLSYPSGISIGSASQSVTIPDTPEYRMKNYSFHIPDKLEITHRELMKDEKGLMEKSKKQLTSINSSLDKTKESLRKIRSLLERDAQESLKETDKNITDAENAMDSFRTHRLPAVLEDLRAQRQGISRSRGVFKAVSGLLPLMFLVIGLITTALAASGGAKLFQQRSTTA